VAQKSLVNYKFNIAVTDYNLKDVREILQEKTDDIAALKLFLAGSSANEFVEDTEQIKRIFDLSLQNDLPVIIHTELQKCIEKHQKLYTNPDILQHNAIRHRDCANAGTELVIKLAKDTGNKIYIAHTSTAEEIEIIRQNKSKVNIYCEVTPHHLLLNDSVLAQAGNYAKVNPPIRTAADNQALWQGIADGTVDTIGTDHAPHLLTEKQRDYSQAPSGFPGLETALPLLLNEVNRGHLSLEKLTELTSLNAAEIFKLESKGKLQAGFDADLTVVDFEAEW
jgi:dihydroorotase